MNTLGQYQDDISDLSNLELERYERIFKIYKQSNNGKDFYFYNILNKIEFPDDIDPDLLDSYNVGSRTALTTISHNIYENIESWWIIFLLNKGKLPNLFYADAGTSLRYIKPDRLTLIYNQITRNLLYNGRHF